MQKILELLRKYELYAKKRKCTFYTSHVKHLGFIVSEEGISIDLAKVRDIIEWPEPKNVSEVRGFLGIIGWYRSFIKDYASIASPLTRLLKKGTKIDWKSHHQQSFDNLKRIVTSAPCLKLPDFTKGFEVITDASGIAVGGVLT